jgi:hypothetical protein
MHIVLRFVYLESVKRESAAIGNGKQSATKGADLFFGLDAGI